jgi:hypothetical protein
MLRPLPHVTAAPLPPLVDLVGQLRDDRGQVTDDAQVSYVEDRGLGVLADGHDGLRRLHPGPVLDGTGNADRQVELGRDGLARLPDLVGLRVPARVNLALGSIILILVEVSEG